MSTVEQIEAAIRALSACERDRLAKDIPKLFPELDGDAAWDQIMHDERTRAGSPCHIGSRLAACAPR